MTILVTMWVGETEEQRGQVTHSVLVSVGQNKDSNPNILILSFLHFAFCC